MLEGVSTDGLFIRKTRHGDEPPPRKRVSHVTPKNPQREPGMNIKRTLNYEVHTNHSGE